MEDVNSWLTWSFCLAALAAAVLAAKDLELRAITDLNKFLFRSQKMCVGTKTGGKQNICQGIISIQILKGTISITKFAAEQ